MKFKISPYQGATATFVGYTIEGYKLISLERHSEKVVCKYQKL